MDTVQMEKGTKRGKKDGEKIKNLSLEEKKAWAKLHCPFENETAKMFYMIHIGADINVFR